MIAVHNSVETVNAAAAAIVTAESRVQPPSHPRKRWGKWWNLYWCFKSQNNYKSLNHAALVPEPVTGPKTTETLTNFTSVIVPPSSPASFLQSDPPSASQTPGGPLTTNVYSPPGPPSIFATGPYAHEKQLVSPPVFSTFTTEPSTASFTPPVDSPDVVPFSHQKKLMLSQYDFQPYQGSPCMPLPSSSPVSNLVSPGSVVSYSGTSSPYLDKNFSLKFHIGEEVPKILALDNFSIRDWGSRLGGSDTDAVTDHRVSFELNREDDSVSKEEGNLEKYRTISFGSINEFNFDNSEKSEWWANEKIIGEDLDSQNNWTFFPQVQSGVI